MKMLLATLHGALLTLLVITGILYPGMWLWVAMSALTTLVCGTLSMALASCRIQDAARIGGVVLNLLLLLLSVIALLGYSCGQKWLLIAAVGVMLFAAMATGLICKADVFAEP